MTHKRLTKDQVKEIKRLFKKGWSRPDIAERFSVSWTITYYHTNPKYRKSMIDHNKKVTKKLYKKGKAWSQKNPKRRREYMKKYYNERYHNDPKFRKQAKKYAMDWQRRQRRKKK